jgi:hypothetical protein
MHIERQDVSSVIDWNKIESKTKLETVRIISLLQPSELSMGIEFRRTWDELESLGAQLLAQPRPEAVLISDGSSLAMINIGK